MNVALYARVSSEKQAEKDLSLPAQLKALRDFALKREWNIIQEYVDAAESARTADRPKFQEMISIAKHKNPPFQAILVWKLNRFARNREDPIVYKSLLRKKGIHVISINEKFEDNATGKLMEAIVEAMDEFYSANLSQDTVRGMRENASRGFWNGGSIPFGYQIEKTIVGRNSKNKLKIIPHEAEIIKRIYSLCLKGYGLKEISKMLNNDGFRRRSGEPWTISTIAYILKNETYTGAVIWRDHKHNAPVIKTQNAHEAIINKRDHEEVQGLLKKRTRFVVPPRALASDHLLSTFLKCKKCGQSMAACGAKSGRYHYYTCQRYAKMGPQYCKQKLLNAEKLESFIVKTLRERVLTEENIRNLLIRVNEEMNLFEHDYETQLVALQNTLTEKQERRRNLYKTIEAGTLDFSDIAPRLKELNEEIQSLTEKVQEMEIRKDLKQPIPATDIDLTPYVSSLQEALITGSITERKGFLRKFIKEIRVEYPNLVIEYTIPILVPQKETSPFEEVLCFVQSGDPNGI